MNSSAFPTSAADVWLSRFAKLVVFMTFVLILIGGHTTTSGAGMAFADWPLSHGSLNPAGWWEDLMQRLEHGHRLTAETVGLLVGVLCAWTWRSKWSVPGAILISAAAAAGAAMMGLNPKVVGLVGIGSAASGFAMLLLVTPQRKAGARGPLVRWLCVAAFIGVLAQAVMGGLRVTIESGGDPSTAVIFRVLHGCLAQFELCQLVIIAAMLSPEWQRLPGHADLRGVATTGWIAAGVLFCQLLVGATIRHLGAGLAIPTWPAASPDGSWMPKAHNIYADLNFTHTRFGALLVCIAVGFLVFRALRNAHGEAGIFRPAFGLVVLLVTQVFLGVSVIWEARPPVLTTLHVGNGALMLAVTVLLTVRAQRSARLRAGANSVPHDRSFVEVTA